VGSARAETFTVEKVGVSVSERPPNAGQTTIESDGYEISVATDLNTDAFYDYILTQFKKD
jgi:purine nucleosidase